MYKKKSLGKRKVKTVSYLIILFGVSIFLLNYGFSHNDWAWAVTQTWCTGSGTEGDPYLLENLEIDGLGGDCISIRNSNASFIIRTCTLYNGYNGVYLSTVENGILIANNFSDNTYGIYVYYSSYNEIIGNDLYGETSGTGISLTSSDNNMIDENFIENHYQGIRLEDCSGNTILGNTAYNNSNYGILVLYDSNNNEVTRNIVMNQKYYSGIVVLDSNFTNISENNISGNPLWGIQLEGSSHNHISSNVIFNNKLDGIIIRSEYTAILCVNNNITMNAIYNNTNSGILLDDDCTDIWIWDNNIYRNGMNGIALNYSSFDTCYENLIHDNTDMGIYIGVNSNNSLFFENFLIRNGKHAADFGTNNNWDNGLIGNYWDNYTGPDNNDDGIGDIPHDFGTGIDYLPIVDDGAPRITIISPNSGDVFDDTPSFDIQIDEDYLLSMWYTVAGGLTTFPFTGLNGLIDQVEWDALLDGYITITFYANDKVENMGFAEVIVLKDTQAPIIVCNSPEDDEVFYNTAPSFNLTVTDLSLDEISYSVDGGVTNYTAGAIGTINQAAWTALPIGDVNITFYAKDEAGHLTYAELTVQKKTPTGDGGGELDFFITTILILTFSGVAVVVIIAIRKFKLRSE